MSTQRAWKLLIQQIEGVHLKIKPAKLSDIATKVLEWLTSL